jgi:DNA-binding MurR/RpiR family transcriptional regulator
VRLLDGAGGMLALQATAMSGRDLLLATSFRPYAPETLEVAERAAALSVPVVAITDSPSSPLAAGAEVALLVEKAEVQGVRGLGVVSTLAAALVLATGRRLAHAEGAGRRSGNSRP